MESVDSEFEFIEILNLRQVYANGWLYQVGVTEEVLPVLLEYWSFWVKDLKEQLLNHLVDNV